MFPTCDHGPGVPDHVVGGGGGQHVVVGVAAVVIGEWGCALKSSLSITQGGRNVLAWGLYRYMDKVLMMSSLMKAQDKVVMVMVLRANNLACIWYGWVPHSALLRSFPFARVTMLPEQKWSSIYFGKLSNITWILQVFCTLLRTWPVSWTVPA